MPQYASPSRRERPVPGPYVEWFLNDNWVKFKIISNDVDLPEEATLIGHVVNDDHLEELYQYGDQFFRHAGGGRGFYWTQELQVVE